MRFDMHIVTFSVRDQIITGLRLLHRCKVICPPALCFVAPKTCNACASPKNNSNTARWIVAAISTWTAWAQDFKANLICHITSITHFHVQNHFIKTASRVDNHRLSTFKKNPALRQRLNLLVTLNPKPTYREPLFSP